MTKAQIITELHKMGNFWANETYTKAELQNYLDNERQAREMTLEELVAKIGERR